jgi:integrase
MAQTLIKINYEGEKCAGLYLVDEDFGGSVITKSDAPQGRGTYKLVLRQTVSVLGHGKITAKETFVKQGTTFLKAIQSVIAEREAMKQRVIDNATGVTAELEETAKEQATKDKLTLNNLWDAYYIYKTTTTRQPRKQKKWDTKQGATGYIMKISYNSLVKERLGSMLVKDIKKKHIQEHVDYLIDGLGKAQRTAKTATIMLKPMFDWYFDKEEIDRRNPAQIEWGTLGNERNVVVEYEDMQKLYKTMFHYKDKKYRNVFIWLASGRRIGEVLSLHSDNIKGDYFTVTADNNKAGVDMIYRMSNAMMS